MAKKQKIEDLQKTLLKIGHADLQKRIDVYYMLITLLHKRELMNEKKLDTLLGKGSGSAILSVKLSCLPAGLLVRYTARIIFLSFSGQLK